MVIEIFAKQRATLATNGAAFVAKGAKKFEIHVSFFFFFYTIINNLLLV